MFWEKKLEAWAANLRGRSAMPLRIDLWNGRQLNFCSGQPQVIIKIPDVSGLACLLTPSLSNLGAAYVEGKIDVYGEPGAIISIGNTLASHSLKLEGKFARVSRNLRRSKAKDQQAIQYHYDVSNDFYRLWLDENMVYSCAYFENGNEDLATAQIKKIDHILTKIRLRPGDRLLDIGCGWGALVLRAAKNYGARCVGITLSENQATLARETVAREGLSEVIEIRLQDYRDVSGCFDRITSIGMFEHVGLSELPAYFAKIQSLLTDDGLVMNHGITSTDPESGETPYGSGEFIERYVFPYGALPHIGLALKAIQQGGLETLDVENLRRHYARTCGLWKESFEAKSEEIRRLAGDRRYRIWRVYLAGCEYAFNQDWISVYQVVCAKAAHNPSQLPWSRRHMYRADQLQAAPDRAERK
ncbi:MAG: class I SAM-dependent methyltransferase [Burkholderiales bacterium]|nr:class I SAM-dependent methyltransferase [Burkholderiales bacterium]